MIGGSPCRLALVVARGPICRHRRRTTGGGGTTQPDGAAVTTEVASRVGRDAARPRSGIRARTGRPAGGQSTIHLDRSTPRPGRCQPRGRVVPPPTGRCLKANRRSVAPGHTGIDGQSVDGIGGNGHHRSRLMQSGDGVGHVETRSSIRPRAANHRAGGPPRARAGSRPVRSGRTSTPTYPASRALADMGPPGGAPTRERGFPPAQPAAAAIEDGTSSASRPRLSGDKSAVRFVITYLRVQGRPLSGRDVRGIGDDQHGHVQPGAGQRPNHDPSASWTRRWPPAEDAASLERLVRQLERGPRGVGGPHLDATSVAGPSPAGPVAALLPHPRAQETGR